MSVSQQESNTQIGTNRWSVDTRRKNRQDPAGMTEMKPDITGQQIRRTDKDIITK